MRGDHQANVERIAQALIDEACRQLADGRGEIDTSGGPAFVTLSTAPTQSLDFEKLAELAIRECRQFRRG